MRRRYAFEAEGVSEEVKAQLEKVEDAVEDKCTTEEACDKMLDKVSEEKEKFDDALQTMADAAKDCKDGKCDKAEMAEKITPKMAELKEVAKSIGVASEGEALTEAELKDARDYLNGVEEIVEAKKDEVSEGGSVSDDDEDDDEEAVEAYLDDIALAMESYTLDMAMEGTNIEALGTVKSTLGRIRSLKKDMNRDAKAGNYESAAAKAREAATAAGELVTALDNLPQSAVSAAIVAAAVTVLGLLTGKVVGKGIGNIAGRVKGSSEAGKAAKDAIKSAASNHAHAGRTVADWMEMGLDKESAKAAVKGTADTIKRGVDAVKATQKTRAFKDATKAFVKSAGAAGEVGGMKVGKVAGAAFGAAAAAGASGSSAIMKVLQQRKMWKNGEIDHAEIKKLGANDFNILISALKIGARNLQKKYENLAKGYADMASNAPASESFSSDIFEGFINACESFQFNAGNSHSNDAPFLFD